MIKKKFDILNLGSGLRPMKDAVNLDIKDYSHLGVGDFVQDDFNTILPFENNSFREVYMIHSLEHVEDVWFVLKEIHRVLKKGGKAIIKVPYYKWPAAFSVLTHNYYFTYRALDKLESEHKLFKVNKRLKFYSHRKFWQCITFPLEVFINLIPVFYETSILSTLLPAPEIEYILTKI